MDREKTKRTHRYKIIDVSVSGGIAIIRLDGAGSIHTLTADSKRELADFLVRAGIDSRIRAVLLTGKGRVFCIGSDLLVKAVSTGGRGGREGDRHIHLASLIRDLDKPVVAAVNGYAIGAGLDLALACDMVVASADARFCTVPAYDRTHVENGSYRALHTEDREDRVSSRHIFSAGRIDAQEALHRGIIDRLVQGENLYREAKAIAESMSVGKTVSMAFAKRRRDRDAETCESAWLRRQLV